jgi:F-type H+-transporting ATPase subunit a
MHGVSPLETAPLFHIGTVVISLTVATTWGLMALMTFVSWLAFRKAAVEAGTAQSIGEIVVETIADQVEDALGRDPWPFLPLIGTLFLFIACANLVGVVPDLRSPTAHLETTGALAVIVFLSAHIYGVRSSGLRGYLAHYLKPNPLFLPLTILSEITRTFSLMVRLFGNIMSHELVIGIVLALAGLIVPVPFMVLGIMIGLVQAYVFSILAAVYIGAAISGSEA